MACGGDPESNNANNTNNNTNNNTTNNNTTNNNTNNNNTNNNNTTTDTTPPTVSITDDVSAATASGDVTFTFTFSEDVQMSFGAASIAVSGGTAGEFNWVDATEATFVVAPPADSTGSLKVTVAAGAFMDLAGNPNTDEVSAEQAFDTQVIVTPVQMDLPVSFDDAGVKYGLLGFGGAEDSTIDADPTDSTNQVAKVVRSAGSETYAGTTLTEDGTLGFASRIPFDADNTRMTLRVYSPASGLAIRLKVEDAGDAGVSVETDAVTTMADAWETLTFEFVNQAPGTAALNVAANYNKATVFCNFGVAGSVAGEQTFYFDDMIFIGGTTTTGPTGDFETLDFEAGAVSYALIGFGGAEDATVVVDPTDGTNQVARIVKSGTAELWAGTTIATGPNDSVGLMPFDAQNTRMTVRVYSPDAGIPVRLKIENAADPTVTVETEAMTTTANAWETLTFDFVNEAAGTAAINFGSTYNKISIFFNFGTTGAMAGEKIYHFDDVTFIGGTGGGTNPGAFIPLDFEAGAVTYTLTGFGGAEDATIVGDPAGGANQVARIVKSATAELWAGTTIATGAMESVGIMPFDAQNTRMTVRVYSPDAGIPVRLKIEDAADPTHTVETEAMTTTANAWETLTFDFVNEAAGTAAINFTFTYNKISIFFNFGTTGAMAGAKTYFCDDVTFIGGTGGGTNPGSFAPLDFEAGAVTYTLTGFGGAEDATIVGDPAGGANQVARIVKSATAELWAGTTIATGAMESVGIMPFDAQNTRMTVRVYSPDAGIPVRLKIEDAADPTRTVETEAMTTMANAWETLTFDFTNQAAGTAAINFTFTYNKISIFFNFGTTGAMAGAKTYFCDDVTFIGGTGGGTNPGTFAPLDFEAGALTYTLIGFGGAEDATIVGDPAGGGNQVARIVKSATAELWAGTTIATGAMESVATIPLIAGAARMTVRVYSPDAGIPVRLKVETAGDPTRSVETEAVTTQVNTWETLTFNFENQATGTAAYNPSFTYNKVSIFFNFGTTGAMAGAKTYFCDDLSYLP